MNDNFLCGSKRPPIYVTEADYSALSSLITVSSPEESGLALLSEELDRATRVKWDPMCAFVKLGSYVEFKELESGKVRHAFLCMPRDADINSSRISVISPVGASLLGLTVDSRFQWTGADGRQRRLEVLYIEDPVAAA